MYDRLEPKRTNTSEHLSPRRAKRIQRDICNIVSTPPEGIFVEPDDANFRIMDILMMGPEDTPYEGGMFHFLVELPNEYPDRPPKVKLLTAGNGRVSFNPNFCGCGMVCLSILGTWADKGYLLDCTWSPVIKLPELMVAIQSTPAVFGGHEPDSNTLLSPDKKAYENYNEKVQYETIRLAAIDVYENKNSYPKTFISEIEKAFVKNYDFYIKVCNKKINESLYDYKTLLNKLEALKPCQESVTS